MPTTEFKFKYGIVLFFTKDDIPQGAKLFGVSPFAKENEKPKTEAGFFTVKISKTKNWPENMGTPVWAIFQSPEGIK